MSCEEVPPVVLFVARAALGRVRARVADVPHVAMQAVLGRGLAYARDAGGLQARHHLAVEVAHALQLGAANLRRGEGRCEREV